MKKNLGEMEHKYKVRMMKLKPSLIGLDGIALSCGESPLFDGKEIIREPDGLMFDPSTMTLYNIEYKLHYSTSSRGRAKKQLRDCSRLLGDIFDDWKIKNLYIYDNYSIEEIK